MGKMRGCAQHSVCFLSFLTWLLGCSLIGIMMWILATSPAVRQFFLGTTVQDDEGRVEKAETSTPVTEEEDSELTYQKIFTYAVLVLGSLLFMNGMLGWIGSYRRGNCLMKVFLLTSVLTVAGEVGGIVALNILNMKMTDILDMAWKEVNENTRNIIQEQLHCCGFTGPEDYTKNTEVIHESCYNSVVTGNDTSLVMEVRRLNRVGCKDTLLDWFYSNKYIWISSLGAVLLFQVASVLFAVYLVNQMKRSRESSSQSLNVDPMGHSQSYF